MTKEEMVELSAGDAEFLAELVHYSELGTLIGTKSQAEEKPQ
jgi:hypothetical protein